MWEISLNRQLFGFFVSLLLGLGYCLLYDLLRAKRKVIGSSNIGLFFEDVIYFAVIAMVTFCFLLPLTNGIVRFYIIFAIILGFVFCRVLISKLFLAIAVFIIKVACKISCIIIKKAREFFIKIYIILNKLVKSLKKSKRSTKAEKTLEKLE